MPRWTHPNIAHGYFDIDGEIVFDIVKNDLDSLLSAINHFIDKTKPNDQ